MVSWLAVFAIIIGVWLVYKGQLSAILFGNSQSGSTIIPSPGNPTGKALVQPTSPPAGQSGQFGVDQNGDLYKKVGGQWVPWGTTSGPAGLASLSSLQGTVV